MDYDFETLKSIVAPIAKKHGIGRMYLFGSRARGDNSPQSDYDFCIVPSKRMSPIDLSNLIQDLTGALESEVDVVYEDSISRELLNSITKERRIVYDGK